MEWKIEFDKKATVELLKLDKQVQKRIIKFIEKIKNNPKSLGAPLHSNLSGLWKYRVGDYRLISKFEDKKLIILIISVGHRSKVYKQK